MLTDKLARITTSQVSRTDLEMRNSLGSMLLSNTELYLNFHSWLREIKFRIGNKLKARKLSAKYLKLMALKRSKV